MKLTYLLSDTYWFVIVQSISLSEENKERKRKSTKVTQKLTNEGWVCLCKVRTRGFFFNFGPLNVNLWANYVDP